MTMKTLREKIEIIGGIGLMVAAVLGWSWFIWSLGGNGLPPLAKIGCVVASYALIAFYLWAGDQGCGVIAVKIINPDDRR